jgi:hypothetical protein
MELVMLGWTISLDAANGITKAKAATLAMKAIVDISSVDY